MSLELPSQCPVQHEIYKEEAEWFICIHVKRIQVDRDIFMLFNRFVLGLTVLWADLITKSSKRFSRSFLYWYCYLLSYSPLFACRKNTFNNQFSRYTDRLGTSVLNEHNTARSQTCSDFCGMPSHHSETLWDALHARLIPCTIRSYYKIP